MSALPQTVPLVVKSISVCRNTCSPMIGELQFLRGWQLGSPEVSFGGLSTLIATVRDGKTHLLSASDKGHWFSFEIPADSGAQSTMQIGQMGPIKDASGRPVQGDMVDAEGLAQGPDGELFVSFEDRQRLWSFSQGVLAPATDLGVSDALDNSCTSGSHLGMEAIAMVNSSHLLGICEAGPLGEVSLMPMLLINVTTKATRASWEQHGYFAASRNGFQPVDAARLPDPAPPSPGLTRTYLGGLLVLEREYVPLVGTNVRISHLGAETWDASTHGGVFRSRVLAELDTHMHTVDNFEGMAVVRDATQPDKVRIYLISNDKMIRAKERTLLYEFIMADATTTTDVSADPTPTGGAPAAGAQLAGQAGSAPAGQAAGQAAPCGNPLCTAKVLAADAGGHACGARMDWLVSRGSSRQAACHRVAKIEFPAVCGGCAPPPLTANAAQQTLQAQPPHHTAISTRFRWESPDRTSRQGACRVAGGARGVYTEQWGVSSDAECRALCAKDTHCRAYEYGAFKAYSRCEIHSGNVAEVLPVAGTVCYLKII